MRLEEPKPTTAAVEVLQSLKSSMWTEPKKIAIISENCHSRYANFIEHNKVLNAKKMVQNKHITGWSDTNGFTKLCYNLPKIYTIKLWGNDRQVQILSAGFTNENQDSYTGGPSTIVNEYG